MKIAVMQPYFLPYIGYWQLINSVDKFVFYDDVNYIKQGYINRNKILSNGNLIYITLCLGSASSFRLINSIDIVGGKDKILKTIYHSYSKAAHFDECYPILENILKADQINLARFVGESLRTISSALGLNCEFLYSSDLNREHTGDAQNNVISISKSLGATMYINSIGGQKLYDSKTFQSSGIQLKFINPYIDCYKQLSNSFVPNLSIVDILMNLGLKRVRSSLENPRFI